MTGPKLAHAWTPWVVALLLLLAAVPLRADVASASSARLETIAVPSRHVPERLVRVWLPPGYAGSGQHYPVVYMHDGQRVFSLAASDGSGFGSWETDLAMERLLQAGKIRSAIVVAIDNTPNRGGEYMPQAAYRLARAQGRAVRSSYGIAVEDIQSDNYLRFLVEELKPVVDSRYRTAPGREDTFIIGSSMGGLISLYALSEYPEVFGGAACLSTHWPIGQGSAVDHFRDHLPEPGNHRIYFDRGTLTLDASYDAYQTAVDDILQRRGYVRGVDFESLVFEGAEHNETSWAERLEVPLAFLLGNRE